MTASSSKNTVAELSQALLLTQTMQQKAQQQEWSELPELEQQRQTILDSVFPISDRDVSSEVRSIIQQIIDLNQQLEVICKQVKDDLNIQLKSFNHSKKATEAYAST